MTAPDLLPRVKHLLQREILWMEESIAEVDRMLAGLSRETVEDFSTPQLEREAQLAHLAREHAGLLHEWRRALNIPEEGRQAVRALNEQTEHLREQLQARYEKAAECVTREMGMNKTTQDTLQRGLKGVGKYRLGDDETGHFETMA